MAAFTRQVRLPPLIVVLGATGTGKSKLALELAKHFNGEIISADSMQVYRSLDFITNKVTKEQQMEVKHHMIDCVSPLERYTVVDFKNKALPILENLLKSNTLPVIVGGTNYYIEALLWKVLMDSDEDSSDELVFAKDEKFSKIMNLKLKNIITENLKKRNLSQGGQKTNIVLEESLASSIQNESSLNEITFRDANIENIPLELSLNFDGLHHIDSAILHQCLAEIDPLRADELHPNERRKIIRSLQVYDRVGRPHSEIIAEQKMLPGGGTLGGPLRFSHTCVLWIQCQQTVLDERLDKRVDEMLERGLIQELSDFHEEYNKQRLLEKKDADYTKGIFQSIGFKEFHPFLVCPENSSSQNYFDQGVSQLKLVTRRYARKQLKWIKHRFLRYDRQDLIVYPLDGTFLDEWNDKVLAPAIQIVDAILQGHDVPVPAHPREDHPVCIHKSHYCESCKRVFVTDLQWQIHLCSHGHHKKLQRSRKKLMQNSNKKYKNKS